MWPGSRWSPTCSPRTTCRPITATIAEHFTVDDAWGAWVNRWTVEENRHGIALRDYLVVTRAVDPIALGASPDCAGDRGLQPRPARPAAIRPDSMLDALSYVTFQELATRVSHRNTGRACDEPDRRPTAQAVAADENLHMIFYRGLTAAALDISPDQAMTSVWRILVNFQMPGFAIPELSPQRGEDRRRRHLRPAPASRRRRHAGAAEVANLRARRLRPGRCAAARRACGVHQARWTRKRRSSKNRRPATSNVKPEKPTATRRRSRPSL